MTAKTLRTMLFGRERRQGGLITGAQLAPENEPAAGEERNAARA